MIIFGKCDLKSEVFVTTFIEGVIETVGIQIGNTYILNIYRPPSGNKQIFFDELSSLLDSLAGKDIILTGDFNIDFKTKSNEWEALCSQYGISYKIKGITRPASGTCLDNFISNINGVFSITNISIADHLAIRAAIKLKSPLKRTKLKHTYRIMKELNWLHFKNGVHNLVPNGNSLDEKWANLSEEIKKLIEISFPSRSSKRNYKFQMSRGLMKSRDKKNRLLREYKLGRVDKLVYINYNKVYRKLIQVEQEKAFKTKINEAGTCGKQKWKVLKKEILLEKDSKKITKIVINNEPVENEQCIAECFKNHFETCATSLALNLPASQDTCGVMPQGDDWSFKTVTESDIVKIISSLKNKNSCGPDLLSNRMIKTEKYAFARLLRPLINECIIVGHFPESLKSALVIPIFKKGAQDNLNNYRPISLLPVMSKVFEKVLNEQITRVIENGYIDDNQFGFRKAYSTEDALMKFADHVQKELSTKKHVVSVFVDVSKAFDSCDHDVLLTKIRRTGLDGNGINLIKCYLKDREQRVFVNGFDGGSFKINIGVGQGTILGPTFFKIYIMDLHLHTNLFTIKFADDSNFIGTSNTKDSVEALVNLELDKIGNWFKHNRLTLHPNKSKYMVHSKDKLVEIRLNGVILKRSGYGLQEESVRMLGIEIDENLDWKCQINSVIKKISKGNYILWRHKKKLSNNLKKTIYESFVRCHILYGITVWGGAKSNNLKPLERLLSKIWSKIGHRRMHTLTRLKKFGILKLADELQLQEYKTIWKWENKKIPTSLLSIISERLDNLRGRRFNISRTCKAGSVNQRLTSRANNCIQEIASIGSKKSLSKKIRKKILDSYSFTCRQRNCFTCGN